MSKKSLTLNNGLPGPKNPKQAAEILKEQAALGAKIKVYAKAGGAEFKLDLRGLNGIGGIDSANLTLKAGPGVKLSELDKALRAAKLRFVPAQSPFLKNHTLGELFGLGLPNLLAARYGQARQMLLASQVALLSGEIISTGGQTVKNVTGYDLTRLFNSPLSGLGVALEYSLKLLPLPASELMLSAVFESPEKLWRFNGELRAADLPLAFALFIEQNYQMACGAAKKPAGIQAFFKLEGELEEVTRAQDILSALLEANAAKQGAPGQAASRLAAKYAALFEPHSGVAYLSDFTLPQSRQREFLRLAADYAATQGFKFGYYGDFLQASPGLWLDCPEARQADAYAYLGEICRGLSGSLSGRFIRLNALERQVSQAEQRLKEAFDPAGLLLG